MHDRDRSQAPVGGAEERARRRPRAETRPSAYLWAVGAVAATTTLAFAMFPPLGLEDVAMLYLTAVMLAAVGGRGPAVLAASLAVLAFDFCFVPPRFTLEISDSRHGITFAVMFGAGLAISGLVARLRRQEGDALRRERQTAALLAFTREIVDAQDVADLAAATVRHLEEAVGAVAALLVPVQSELVALAGLAPLAAHEREVVRRAYDERRATGQGTSVAPDARLLALPLVVADDAVGVVVVQAAALDAEKRRVMEAFVRQAALAIGRARLAAEAREASLRARTEELRSSLLSAVSHDLRTPLAVITGAATTLREGAELTPATRAELLESIVEESRRLERVLANLLDLTRVETGLEPAREWIPVEELIGATLTRLEQALRDREVTVDLEPDLAIAVDPVLFEQALINLVENALRHGAAPFLLRARREGDAVVLEVADRGPGVPPRDTARIFDKFVRSPRTAGVGLGLAVVRGIVEAHGGTVTAEPRDGGGACFRIVLPAAGAPPPPPAALAEAG